MYNIFRRKRCRSKRRLSNGGISYIPAYRGDHRAQFFIFHKKNESLGQVLRDLIIRRDDVKKMWIRLYSLDAIACDCMIDPDAEGGELSIK